MFGNDFKRILDEYNVHKNEDYVNNSFAAEMRGKFRDNLRKIVVNFVNINKYKVKISPGQNEWVEIPWAGIRNIDIAPSFQEGFYVVYLFRKDMSGYYLSLNQGVTSIKRNRLEILKSRADELKKELSEVPTGFSTDSLILNGTKSYSRLYEMGNILSKFYSINDVIDENQLIKDLENILRIYESLMPIYEKLVNGEDLSGTNTVFLDVVDDVKSSYDKNIEKEVITKYGNIFNPDNLDNLTKEEFLEFLVYKNNRHWTGIQRNGPLITQDMNKLQKALKILLDESKPIQERLDILVSKNEDNYVKGLDKAILTPILLVVYPDKYGVYNKRANLGLEVTKSKPTMSKKTSFGEEYVKINEILLDLAKKYDLSLFELDEVWGRMSDYYNKEPKMYWVTVGKTLQSNYKIGIDNNVLGVKEDYKNKASKLKEGDHLLIYSASFGFTLCKIESEAYEDNQRLWPDDIYPVRFKISNPIYQESLKPDNVHNCLTDTNGIPYKSGSAWGRAIGGSGGILREIKPNEIDCLFNKLGWDPLISEITSDTPQILFLNPKDMDPEIKLKEGVLDNIYALLNSGKHILLTGPPGTGKTDLAKYIANEIVKNGFSDGYILTTATSDWTTFDTIGGYMPDNNGGSLSFYEGKFLQAIRENKTLLIDEINRSDIDKAFGQLFTVLSGQGVEIPFILDSNHVKIIPNNGEINSCRNEADSSYIVGKNWRIISTMNVFDKNYLFEMSYAFMRRFAFIYIDLPEDDDYKYLIHEKWAKKLDEGYIELIEKLLDINEYRPLGPAIFKDICEFVKNRVKLLDNPEEVNNKILIDAFISFIIPQFEGLEISELENIWETLDSYIKDNIETQLRFEEMGFSIKEIKAK